MIGLFGWGIGTSQGLYGKMWLNIYVLNGLKTDDYSM
jgi:hypothetical protein